MEGAGERRFFGSIAFHLPFTAHKSIERKHTNFFWLFIIGSIKGAEREREGRGRGLADKLMDYLRVDTNALLPRLRKAVESTLSIPPIRFQYENVEEETVRKITENFTYKRRQHFLIVFPFFWVKSKATKAHPRAKPSHSRRPRLGPNPVPPTRTQAQPLVYLSLSCSVCL